MTKKRKQAHKHARAHIEAKERQFLELLEGAKITPEELREKGDELKETLHAAAAALEKLTSAGWRPLEFAGPGYELMLAKDISLAEAKKEIKALGLENFLEKLCLSRKKVLLMKVRPSLRSREH